MTIAEAVDFINAHVTYKPGYHLYANKVKRSFGEESCVEINMAVPNCEDSDGKRKAQTLTYTERLTEDYIAKGGCDYLVFRVRDFIRRWEEHEADEWFKIDGVRYHEPHSISTNVVNGERVKHL